MVMGKIKDLCSQHLDQIIDWYGGLEAVYQYGVFYLFIVIGFFIIAGFILSRIIK